MSFPAYAPDQLLPALRDHLIAQGVGRHPNVADTLPPLWLDPRRGVPYPGQEEGLTSVQQHDAMHIGLYPATGIPSRPFEGFLVSLGVTIFFRGKTSPPIQTTHEQIRSILHDKRDLNFNGLSVNESMLRRELQRIGSDENGYIYNCEYRFEMWASSYDF